MSEKHSKKEKKRLKFMKTLIHTSLPLKLRESPFL